ncbi:hypothetical protein ACNTMW_32345 [Planosporangium sp. 12N6]|uniref:hypothetical protein n=1 Tax=Planosporangium spinosum TaxID=3402278 RepID=UPI003CEAADC3
MTPDRCLGAADQLLRGSGALGTTAVTGAWWPKACACLVRLALESGLDDFWHRASPPVAACANGRTKQLLLRRYDRRLARRISYAWAALSAATHHHCYEMAPTAGELRRLHTEVITLLETLHALRAARTDR